MSDIARRGRAARRKGRRNETRVAQLYCDAGLGDATIGPNRGRDIRGITDLAIECKDVEKLAIWDALEQAARQATQGQTPVLHFTRNYAPEYVAVREQDWIRLLIELQNLRLQTGVGAAA